jgi:subtilisin family serine protease
VRSLQGSRVVAAAQPNYLFKLQQQSEASASDAAPAAPPHYATEKLRLPQAHGVATGQNVLVAVIDSGIDATHPELAGAVVNTFNALPSPEKAETHGTGMAGVIVAHGKVAGVAPAAHILAVRAFDGSDGNTFAILKGLDWAAANGARVINMSFAGPADPAIGRSLAAARKLGIVLVAATGNAGAKSPPLYPAADPNVIAVTATDADDKLFDLSNRGRYVAVAAPGVDILAPGPDATYQVGSGTSFAAANVSGVVALMLQQRPGQKPEAIRATLMATARDLGPKGFDEQFGAGLADAFAAVTANEPVAAARN